MCIQIHTYIHTYIYTYTFIYLYTYIDNVQAHISRRPDSGHLGGPGRERLECLPAVPRPGGRVVEAEDREDVRLEAAHRRSLGPEATYASLLTSGGHFCTFRYIRECTDVHVMYICMKTYMYVYIYIYTHVQMHIIMRTVYVYEHTSHSVHSCVQIGVYTHICISTSRCKCRCGCRCLCSS